MKLRIKGNSIRLRLTKTEIVNFGEHWILEERTEFPNAVFLDYCLQAKTGIDKLEAEFTQNKITVLVPVTMVQQWTTTEIVGFENNMDFGDGKQLFLLIEKDFVCLDETIEDQSDNYENPSKTC